MKVLVHQVKLWLGEKDLRTYYSTVRPYLIAFDYPESQIIESVNLMWNKSSDLDLTGIGDQYLKTFCIDILENQVICERLVTWLEEITSDVTLKNYLGNNPRMWKNYPEMKREGFDMLDFMGFQVLQESQVKVFSYTNPIQPLERLKGFSVSNFYGYPEVRFVRERLGFFDNAYEILVDLGEVKSLRLYPLYLPTNVTFTITNDKSITKVKEIMVWRKIN